jgi:DNA repair protein RadC
VNGESKTLEEALADVTSQIKHTQKESFFLICLNLRNKCIGPPSRVGEGSKYHVLVDPREVLNRAIQREAGRMVLIHNHPSLDAQPSPQDILLTKRIMEGCAWVDIELYDHVIVTKKEMFSMRANGMLG